MEAMELASSFPSSYSLLIDAGSIINRNPRCRIAARLSMFPKGRKDPQKYQNASNAIALFPSNLQCLMHCIGERRKNFKLLMASEQASFLVCSYQRLQTLCFASSKMFSSIFCHSPNTVSSQIKFQNVLCWQEKFMLGIGTVFFRMVVNTMLIISVSITISKVPSWALTEENRIFLDAWRTVDRAYFDKTFNGQNWFRYRENALRNEPMNNREETYMAIKKMLSTLDDPFTRFLEPEKFKSLRSGTQGALTGVGLSIGYPIGLDVSSTGLIVLSASPGGPANKIGIKPGDIILAIDDRSTEDMDIYEAAEFLQGTEGSTVKLEIRSGPEIKHMVLRREKITLNPVKSRLCEVAGQGNDISRIGYIKLTSFSQNASGAVKEAFGYEELPYVGGAAPRTNVVGRVFTANESPPDQKIPFHHEMAQVPEYPSKLFFFCEVEPRSGGETPIVLSHYIYERMYEKHPEFVERLEKHGLIYTRVLGIGDDPSSPIGRGWHSTFLTKDKSVAEERAARLGMKLEWIEDGVKSIMGPIPAIKFDATRGRKIWFNSMVAAYTGWKDARNDPVKAVTFGDGTPLPSDVIYDCLKTLEEDSVAIPWKQGDILLLDNLAVLHSRRSFEPPRRILASLCK